MKTKTHGYLNVSASFAPGQVKVREFHDSTKESWAALELESWGAGRGLILAVYLDDPAQVDELETALHKVRAHLTTHKASRMRPNEQTTPARC
jgi:hypothetical protein